MEEGNKETGQTIRQRIIELLAGEAMTARDLSKILGIRERAVYGHLQHAAKTVTQKGKELKVLPFACLACGYVFRERRRFTPPGRCPKCKRAHLERPRYRIV